MRSSSPTKPRVLAIDPSVQGFGFAVLEGATHLIDWGAKTVKGDKNSQSLKRIEGLIKYYLPDVIVIEDYKGKGSRRCNRVKSLIDDIEGLITTRKIRPKRFSRKLVRQVFSSHDANTKHEIAVTITQHFPELAPYLPRARKAWMIEDNRMNIFDAIALALTYLKF